MAEGQVQESSVLSEESFTVFDARLTSYGLRDALAWLVGLTDYRFIAIFGFNAGKATALVYFDKQNPDVLSNEESSEEATYCWYVRDTAATFTAVDSLTDPRLTEHPKREVVRAYCGFPIMDAEGGVLGTLCHYDVVSRNPEQIDMNLMLQVASKLAYGNLLPPYPTR